MKHNQALFISGNSIGWNDLHTYNMQHMAIKLFSFQKAPKQMIPNYMTPWHLRI
jgi:hypothetical protein